MAATTDDRYILKPELEAFAYEIRERFVVIDRKHRYAIREYIALEGTPPEGFTPYCAMVQVKICDTPQGPVTNEVEHKLDGSTLIESALWLHSNIADIRKAMVTRGQAELKRRQLAANAQLAKDPLISRQLGIRGSNINGGKQRKGRSR